MAETNKEKDEGVPVRVKKDVYIWLESKKIHQRQSFNEVLEEMMRCEQ